MHRASYAVPTHNPTTSVYGSAVKASPRAVRAPPSRRRDSIASTWRPFSSTCVTSREPRRRAPLPLSRLHPNVWSKAKPVGDENDGAETRINKTWFRRACGRPQPSTPRPDPLGLGHGCPRPSRPACSISSFACTCAVVVLRSPYSTQTHACHSYRVSRSIGRPKPQPRIAPPCAC